MSIETAFNERRNNFNALRLFAALLVLWSHSYPIATGENRDEIFSLISGGFDTGGGYGVSIFFVISGFLVTRSLQRHEAADYLKSRLLRIVPALIPLTLFEIFVIGLRFTHLPAEEFLQQTQTWRHLLNPTVFSLSPNLPGVFDDLPAKTVNGSLWTLPLECGFYLLLPLFSAVALLTERGMLAALGALATLYGVATWHLGMGWESQGLLLWSGTSAYVAMRYGLFFLSGAGLWIWRRRLPLDGGLACCALLVLFASARTSGATLAYFVCLPYVVVYAALARPLPFDIGERIGDLSYGIYLYAFPIQQAVLVLLGPDASPTQISAIATPVSLALAYLSWKIVESPCLSLRRRFS